MFLITRFAIKIHSHSFWFLISAPPAPVPATKQFFVFPLSNIEINNMGANTELLLGSVKIVNENNLDHNIYDGILLVAPPVKDMKSSLFTDVISKALKYDPSLESETIILPLDNLNANRLVYAPTGTLNSDYNDIRSFQEAAVKGLKKAVKAGIRKLLVVLDDYAKFKNTQLVTLLGVLEALYTPKHLRDLDHSKAKKLDILGVYTNDINKTQKIIELALNLENGRHVARDIGGGDPERMSPINVQKYVEKVFAGSNIKITVIDDLETLETEYPLFAAVNRAASGIERHRGRIMYLEYNPPAEVTKTLLLVGKGVTYDTGGADIKAGGIMSSMSRDKCGAAAVAGFMKIISLLKPQNTKVVGALSLVRNSVGSDAYVSDELIVSRSKKIIRIGNTDAEGRMIMADVLCKMKEIAVDAINPHIFTIATLTGHACLAVGDGYSIVMDNGPARSANNAQLLQEHGDSVGDPFEISTLRREDFQFHSGKTEGEDILQANNLPSVRTPRGHQGPGAFLILASGLDQHGLDSENPLKYSHLDIAASAGDFPHPATGAPIVALADAFLL